VAKNYFTDEYVFFMREIGTQKGRWVRAYFVS